MNGTNLTQQASQIQLSSAFSVGGFAYDGAYRLLLERDTDTVGQTDLFLTTFPTVDDLVNGTNLTQLASQIQLSSAFPVGGLAYDGFPPPPVAVAEPGIWSLLLTGLAGVFFSGRWKRASQMRGT